jgi:hypothetical protein
LELPNDFSNSNTPFIFVAWLSNVTAFPSINHLSLSVYWSINLSIYIIYLFFSFIYIDPWIPTLFSELHSFCYHLPLLWSLFVSDFASGRLLKLTSVSDLF